MKFYKCTLFLILFSICLPIKKVYVQTIDYKGNANFQDDDLSSFLRLKKKSFMSTTEFKSNKLNLDLIDIQSFYKSQGFLDVKVDYIYDYIDENNVSIQFLISEGIRYKLGDISIIGNKSFKYFTILNDSEYYNPLNIRKQLNIQKPLNILKSKRNKMNNKLSKTLNKSKGNLLADPNFLLFSAISSPIIEI